MSYAGPTKGSSWQIRAPQSRAEMLHASGGARLALSPPWLQHSKRPRTRYTRGVERTSFVGICHVHWQPAGRRRMGAGPTVGLFGNLCAAFDWKALRLSLHYVAMPNPKSTSCTKKCAKYMSRNAEWGWKNAGHAVLLLSINSSQSISQSVTHAFNYPIQFIWTRVHSKLLSKRLLLKQPDEDLKIEEHTHQVASETIGTAFYCCLPAVEFALNLHRNVTVWNAVQFVQLSGLPKHFSWINISVSIKRLPISPNWIQPPPVDTT